MKEIFRQSMAWLHTWIGLIVGWVLLFIFVTGTVGYFYVEIDRWMRPELPLAVAAILPDQSVDVADAYLRREAPSAGRWVIILPNRYNPVLWVDWRSDDGAQRVKREYDVASGRFREPVQPRETGGGFELYRMHWKLHYLPQPLGILIVGVSTMIMLVTLLTGVVAHKKIFTDFFTFRPRKGQRSWLDLHNIVSVTALPFFVMITFSGLVFYAGAYMPTAAQARYGNDHALLEADLYSYGPFIPKAGGLIPKARAQVAATPLPLKYFLSEARRYWGDDAVNGIMVRFPGDAAATVQVSHSGHGTILRDGGEGLVFNAVSGQLIGRYAANQSTPRAIASGLYGLHEGVFAGWPLRWLYFGSGFLGCAMIATGLVLWTVKRRAKQLKTGATSFGFRLVESLNIGTIAGLPVGIATYFWANRLLSVEMAARAEWEIHSLFIAWGIMLIWASIRPPGKAWAEELSVAAVVFGALPLLNALTTDRHLGVTIPAGDWVLASFDLTVLVIGVLFGVAAAKVHQKWTAPVDPRSRSRSIGEIRS